MPERTEEREKIMKKRNYYYVCYYRDFANTYTVCRAPYDVPLPEEWTRITRKQADRLCREERERREYDYNFSGFASSTISAYSEIADFERQELED